MPVQPRLAIFGFLIVATTFPALAQTPSFLGRYAFDWHGDPAKARCVRVDEKLDASFHSAKYRCGSKPVTNTSAGAPAFVCTASKQKGEYLVFTSKKLCEEERETQASNE